MDSTDGQSTRQAPRRRSGETRGRLLDAAAGLIAEVGWGRVTTRAIADAAGLPHGTVSYHFSGKGELLTEAAADVIERMFPIDTLEAVDTLADLTPLVSSTLDSAWTDPVAIKVLLEAMREAGHDQSLRERIAALLRDYRRIIADLVSAEQKRGSVVTTAAPSALATVLAAVGDGLLLHSILDPDLDIAEAAFAMLSVVQTTTPTRTPHR